MPTSGRRLLVKMSVSMRKNMNDALIFVDLKSHSYDQ